MFNPSVSERGFFGIGIFDAKHEVNVGTMMRTAFCLDADFVFTVGRRYKKQASDTTCTERHVPLFEFTDINDLITHLPKGCPLIGIEIAPKALPLTTYCHFEQACYLLGAEDHGIPEEVLKKCKQVVGIPFARMCLNVGVAASIVMYDRKAKRTSISGKQTQKLIKHWEIE